MQDGTGGWVLSARFQRQYPFTSYLAWGVNTHKSERQRQMLRIGDVWIPFSPISVNHFSKFFIPGIEDLFWIKDRTYRVENSRTRSRLISWRAFDDDHFGIQCQMDSTDEQTFTLLPSL
jgi:hypothetical protein